MKAIVQSGYGPPDALELREVQGRHLHALTGPEQHPDNDVNSVPLAVLVPALVIEHWPCGAVSLLCQERGNAPPPGRPRIVSTWRKS